MFLVLFDKYVESQQAVVTSFFCGGAYALYRFSFIFKQYCLLCLQSLGLNSHALF